MASGNFMTWNSLKYDSNSGITFSVGNCKVETTSGYPVILTNFAPKSGKWYCEFYQNAMNGYNIIGILQQGTEFYGNGLPYGTNQYLYYSHNGKVEGNGSSATSYGNSWNSGNPIIGVALDLDNGKLYFSKDGTWQNSGNPATGSNPAFTSINTDDGYYMAFSDYDGGSTACSTTLNAGQDSSFGGAKTSGSANATDSSGFGDFFYTPPDSFLAMTSANLPISDDIDPAQTDDNFPQKQFDTVLYTGNASTNNISNLNFKPDLVWIKIRNTGSNAVLVDSSRGTNKMVHPNNNDAEVTTANLTSFNSDGFSLDGTSSYLANYNGNSNTYVAWCWRANGGTTASNSDGSITSTVQANTKAGFSIITFTSPNSSSDQTVGHSLTKAPEFIIAKNRDSSYNWDCFHIGLDDTTKGLRLNTSETPLSGRWGTVNSSIITTKNAYTHVGTDKYVFYAWHSVEGYSSFGKFEGNSNTDGPMIVTNFRPRLVFCKSIDASENWQVRDTARSTFNADSQVRIYCSSSTASPIDFLSNGFKVRGSNSEINSNTIIYGAWGDVPFKYNNTF